MISPPVFTVKQPGDDRVPPVPMWLEQKCMSLGRRELTITLKDGDAPQTWLAPVFLVVEGMVLGNKPQFEKRTFIGDLTAKDHARLRKLTKDAWLRADVGTRPLTDDEADRIIEQNGPDAAYTAVMDTIRTGALN